MPPPRFLALPCRAQTKPAAAPKKKSFWVGPQTGSNIARGFVEYDSGESTVEWPTEDASLAGAVKNLEARSGTLVDGRLIVWDVVSQQTSVPVSTLQRQNAETRLGAGELLVANSLASSSGKNVNEVIALRKKSSSWTEVAKQLRIDPRSVAVRARAASDSLKQAQTRLARNRARGNQNALQAGQSSAVHEVSGQ